MQFSGQDDDTINSLSYNEAFTKISSHIKSNFTHVVVSMGFDHQKTECIGGVDEYSKMNGKGLQDVLSHVKNSHMCKNVPFLYILEGGYNYQSTFNGASAIWDVEKTVASSGRCSIM